MSSKRRIIVWMADLHSGHSLGLLSPDAHWEQEDADGEITDYYPRLTSTQEYLFGVYEWARKETFKLAGRDDLIVIHGGDLMQGNRYGSLVSPLQNVQQIIAFYNLQPWFGYKKLFSFHLVMGTGAHNYGAGSGEMAVAEVLRARYPKIPIRAYNHGRVKVKCGTGAITLDTAHHGPFPGSRRYLEGNVARLYLRDAMMGDLGLGKEPANIYLRAHYHRKIEERVSFDWQGKSYASWLLETPSFCGLDTFARKTARSPISQTHGLIALEVLNGKMVGDPYFFTRNIDLRTETTI